MPILDKILKENVDVVKHNFIFNYSSSNVNYDYINNKIIINNKTYKCTHVSIYDVTLHEICKFCYFNYDMIFGNPNILILYIVHDNHDHKQKFIDLVKYMSDANVNVKDNSNGYPIELDQENNKIFLKSLDVYDIRNDGTDPLYYFLTENKYNEIKKSKKSKKSKYLKYKRKYIQLKKLQQS